MAAHPGWPTCELKRARTVDLARCVYLPERRQRPVAGVRARRRYPALVTRIRLVHSRARSSSACRASANGRPSQARLVGLSVMVRGELAGPADRNMRDAFVASTRVSIWRMPSASVIVQSRQLACRCSGTGNARASRRRNGPPSRRRRLGRSRPERPARHSDSGNARRRRCRLGRASGRPSRSASRPARRLDHVAERLPCTGLLDKSTTTYART